ncbi:hypothetical protein [Stutzerimonas stutzeri]|uniref:hypothetical protein n=1 Tax=Stutzerimonas stutzeri TaxID=316 RepID=UPI003D008555
MKIVYYTQYTSLSNTHGPFAWIVISDLWHFAMQFHTLACCTNSSTFAKGGGVSTTEYVEQELDGRRVLVDAEGSDFGEYMFVNADGALEFWSENGNFYTAPRAN